MVKWLGLNYRQRNIVDDIYPDETRLILFEEDFALISVVIKPNGDLILHFFFHFYHLRKPHLLWLLFRVEKRSPSKKRFLSVIFRWNCFG
jgi:hypothetical protein